MPRIEISLPDQFAFSTEIQIYSSHVNRGGHLDNSRLLTLVAEARERFFESLGYVNFNVEGINTLVVDAAVKYISQAFRGEVMVVHLSVGDFSNKGCDLLWKMTEKTSGREVARGKTGIVFFDVAARKVAPVPESFRQRVGI